jgi:tetratricopeptide (TPR) repeat protein
VEQALRVLPDVEDLALLRGLVVSSTSSRGTKREAWGAVEPNRTIGKRTIDQTAFRAGVPQLLNRITNRVAVLYDAAAQALESEQKGELSQAVRALVRGGEYEQKEGRHAQAQAWYRQALGIAQQLRERKPEMEALWRLGRLETSRGYLDEGARAFQRALALAEAESDHEHAARACQGLGDVLFAQSQWVGAEAWYDRGLQFTRSNGELASWFFLSLGRTALRCGDPGGAAEWLGRALERFEAIGERVGIVQALLARAQVAAAQRRVSDVLATYREALTRASLEGAELQVMVRLALTEFYLDLDRFRDAEDEARCVENIAIAHQQRGALARVYMLMGRLRAQQQDEDGFVFYEQAIELCRSGEPARLEVDIYREYARFRSAMGDRQEARAYLDRARELVEPFRDELARRQIEDELSTLA